MPRYFYKYRSLRGAAKGYTRDLVMSQKLYFARPPELNDPFEFRPVLDVSLTEPERRAHIKRRAQEYAAEGDRDSIEQQLLAQPPSVTGEKLGASYRLTMDAVGVFSMSARPLDLLMWPHYADNHAGVCVRLDLVTLVNCDYVPMPVAYSDERPVAHPIRDSAVPMIEKAALTKGSPWAYEEEWRLLINEGGGRVVQFEPPVVSGVILGARISPEDRREVLEWVRGCGRPMEVLAADFHERDYALETHPA